MSPQMVTNTLTGRTFAGHTRFARALSLFLLVLIVYGTTIEAAHRHGSAKPDRQTLGTTFVSDSNTTRAPRLKLAGCDDCLICQLHLNFSVTALAIRASDAPRLSLLTFFEVAVFAVHSQTQTPQSGRAPPLA